MTSAQSLQIQPSTRGRLGFCPLLLWDTLKDSIGLNPHPETLRAYRSKPTIIEEERRRGEKKRKEKRRRGAHRKKKRRGEEQKRRRERRGRRREEEEEEEEERKERKKRKKAEYGERRSHRVLSPLTACRCMM